MTCKLLARPSVTKHTLLSYTSALHTCSTRLIQPLIIDSVLAPPTCPGGMSSEGISSDGASSSVERAAEARDRDRHRQRHQSGKRQRVVLQLRECRALEHDRAYDADKVRQRQILADHLSPARHAQKRKDEARQHHVGQKENHRQL